MRHVILLIIVNILSSSLFSAPGDLVWKYKILSSSSNNFRNSPCIGNKKVFICGEESRTGSVFSFNKESGELIWLYKTVDKVIESVPFFSNDVVFIGATDKNWLGTLFALNSTNGNIEWKYCTENTECPFYSPLIASNYLFASSDDFYSLNATNGGFRWKKTALETFNHPSTWNDIVFLSNEIGLYALQIKNGETIWRFEGYGSKYIVPLVYRTFVYYAAQNRNLYSFSTIDGKTIWFRTLEENLVSPCISQEMLYIGANKYIYSLNSNTGSIIWKSYLGEVTHSSPCVAQDAVTSRELVFIGEDIGYIRAFDAENGQLQWAFKTEGSIYSNPCVADSIIYFTSNDGYLYAVKIGFKDGFNNNQSSQHLPSPSLSAYPNPFKDRLTIEASDKAKVYSLSGQFIMKLDKGKHSLDTSSWREGVYLIKSGNLAKRIVKIQ